MYYLCMENNMVDSKDNNPFVFPLLNIKKSIEFCMEKEMDKYVDNPQLLSMMGMLYGELSKINFGKVE